MMLQLNQRKLLKELVKRSRKTVDFLADALPQQRKFIEDPNRLKAILATRRASKSFTFGLYAFKEALENPGVSILYIALTRESAKKIMVKDVMNVINRKYKLGAVHNKSDLSYTLPNGSVIYLLGADADDGEKEKLLGQKYKLVGIDEAASYSINLEDLVYRILKPAMADLRGTIVMIGTPGNVTRGLFFEVTTSKRPDWSWYHWKALDNHFVSLQIKEEMADLIRANPLIVETPLWKQMYLGEWFIDEEKLVYKYKEERNTVDKLPELKGSSQWYYVMGIDLGYEDESAFVVGAYNDYDRNLYIVHDEAKAKMDVTEVANRIKAINKLFPIHKWIVDGAAKQAVEEIRRRHAIPLEAADKMGKSDFIEIMNADFIQGYVKLLKDKAADLASEYLTLVWDEKSLRRQENPACPNHRADAALYMYRYCYQFFAQKFTPTPLAHTKEAVEMFFEQEAEKLANPEGVKPWWEAEW